MARRLRRLSEVLARELDVISLGSKIQSQVQDELDKTQREYFLRQQLKAIQEELGEADEMMAEVKSSASSSTRSICRRRSPPGRPRAQPPGEAPARGGRARCHPRLPGMDRLPAVGQVDRGQPDLEHARTVLDEDHFDIAKVKDRILEFLAVRKLKPDARGSDPVLRRSARGGQDLTGPVHRARLGRKFVRISVGGVRDEAEIRGHRRTYIGALPGRSSSACARRSNNPLFMLDEIDKMGVDYRGRPGVGAARGARPRAELHLPRPLPRRAVRPGR